MVQIIAVDYYATMCCNFATPNASSADLPNWINCQWGVSVKTTGLQNIWI